MPARKRTPLTEEQRALVWQWRGLAKKIAALFVMLPARPFEDCYQVATLGLCDAAQAWDPERISERTGKPVKFVTLACIAIKRQLGQVVTASVRRPQLTGVNLDGILENEDLAQHNAEDVDEVLAILGSLHPADRELMERHYLQGETLEHMGADMGMTKAGVHWKLREIRRKIRESTSQRGEAPDAGP
jgi:RNA polymerase sigma factor (sigma-70 family)